LKLQIYLLRQLVISFLFAVAGILFIALPGIAVTTVHKMPLADASVLLRYIPLVLETLAPYVLPICFLLSVVATYGRLAADREWTAIQMAGFHPARLMLPALGLATVLGGVTFFMVTQELPMAKARQRAALVDAATSSLKNLQPGKTTLHFGGFLLKAGWRDPNDQNLLHDVFIRKPDEETGDAKVEIFAERVHIRTVGDMLRCDLQNAYVVYPDQRAKAELGGTYFTYPLESLAGEDDWGDNRPKYMTNAAIFVELERGDAEADREKDMHYQLHRRLAMSMVFLLFLGLGAPTGLMLRRGTQLGALSVAVGYSLIYYILSMRLGKGLARIDAVPPWLAAWITPAMFLIASVALMRKALRR
jgi:lipopolysaccharide export LptBFGC system permease protein LptF